MGQEKMFDIMNVRFKKSFLTKVAAEMRQQFEFG